MESVTEVSESELTKPESVELGTGTGTDEYWSGIGGIRTVELVESGTEVVGSRIGYHFVKEKNI